jgi:hypothetical protein
MAVHVAGTWRRWLGRAKPAGQEGAYSSAVGRFKPSVYSAFAGDDVSAYHELYLTKLLESWRETTAQLRRTTIQMIGFMVILVLLTSGDIQEVSVGPIKMADLGVAAKLLPVVVGFLYLDLVLQFFSALAYTELYGDVAEELMPSVYAAELDIPLAPTLGAMWGGRSILSIGSHDDRVADIVDVLNALCGVTFVLAPLGVLAWEYLQLFSMFGERDPVLWFSVLATLICVLRAAAVAAYWARQKKWDGLRRTEDRRARRDRADARHE